MTQLVPNPLDPRTPRRLLATAAAGLLVMAGSVGLMAYRDTHPLPGLCTAGPDYPAEPSSAQLHNDLAAMARDNCNAMEYSYTDTNGNRQWAAYGSAPK